MASAIPGMTREWTYIVHRSKSSHAALLIWFCTLLALLYGALHVLVGALTPDLHRPSSRPRSPSLAVPAWFREACSDY